MPANASLARPLCNRLLLGMTGSVSVLLMPYNIFLLRHIFAREVHVLISQAVQQFLTPYALQLCSGRPVWTDTFQITEDILAPHIELTSSADLFLIMPATANMLARAAHGVCDDLISTAIVACTAPVVFVPSMNEAMWSNPTVQRNVESLRGMGHHVIEPGQGYEIANLKQMVGAMPSLESVILRLTQILQNRTVKT